MNAVIFAYRVLFRQFWVLVRVSWLPFTLAALVLYGSLESYLAGLLAFLAAPNERTASLALGTLTGGVLVSLFCYAVGIAAIGRVIAGATARPSIFQFQAERAEWRLYAAYLRFLLLTAIVAAVLTFLAQYVAPRLGIPGRMASTAATGIGCVAVYALVVRIGFFIAPLAANKQGPIIRAAWATSRQDVLRTAGLLIFLVLPGLLIQTAGEYLLREWLGISLFGGDVPIVDSTRFLERALAGFLTVVSASVFVTIVLLTAGSVSFYEARRRVRVGKLLSRSANRSILGAAPPV